MRRLSRRSGGAAEADLLRSKPSVADKCSDLLGVDDSVCNNLQNPWPALSLARLAIARDGGGKQSVERRWPAFPIIDVLVAVKIAVRDSEKIADPDQIGKNATRSTHSSAFVAADMRIRSSATSPMERCCGMTVA